jgi:hypothetical protein
LADLWVFPIITTPPRQLPLIGEMLAYHQSRHSTLIIAILIILPQIFVAWVAPWAGQEVQSRGRRPLLLIGFGALPLRAFLFALITHLVILSPSKP